MLRCSHDGDLALLPLAQLPTHGAMGLHGAMRQLGQAGGVPADTPAFPALRVFRQQGAAHVGAGGVLGGFQTQQDAARVGAVAGGVFGGLQPQQGSAAVGMGAGGVFGGFQSQQVAVGGGAGGVAAKLTRRYPGSLIAARLLFGSQVGGVHESMHNRC